VSEVFFIEPLRSFFVSFFAKGCDSAHDHELEPQCGASATGQQAAACAWPRTFHFPGISTQMNI